MTRNREKNTPKERFTTELLRWNAEKNFREMPWKGEVDPYKIWLSEIILQQTRVDQGTTYYLRILNRFPRIELLAAADDQEVFKLWEGLGYYSRCRNLLAAARQIVNDYGARFPSTYEDILALKGIGPYTAAAISSFAFNLPHAVVDGNVFRVLARIFGIDTPIDTTEGKKLFTNLANELLDRNKPGIYNQAIMDFGATICKPVAPLCKDCVFTKMCAAYLESRIESLPVKEKKINIRKRWFNYLVIEEGNDVLINQRLGKDVWNQLYEFPLVETAAEDSIADVLQHAETLQFLKAGSYRVNGHSGIIRQQLSHQLILGRFVRITVQKKTKVRPPLFWTTRSSLHHYAFPRLVNHYLEGSLQQPLF